MLNDPILNPETQAPRSEHELRLMYSMAVVRLVNGILLHFGYFGRALGSIFVRLFLRFVRNHVGPAGT